jgi:hypothetical protein
MRPNSIRIAAPSLVISAAPIRRSSGACELLDGERPQLVPAPARDDRPLVGVDEALQHLRHGFLGDDMPAVRRRPMREVPELGLGLTVEII